jgi:NADH-quinone oxidoreductase subunit N
MNTLFLLAPALVLSATAFFYLGLDLVTTDHSFTRWSRLNLGVGLVGFAGTFASLCFWKFPAIAGGGMLVADGFGVIIIALVTASALLTSLLLYRATELDDRRPPVTLCLLFLATAGQVILVVANDFLIAFIAIELISIPSILLAAYSRFKERATEAGLKFFVVSAFSSAIFVYGVSLLYGLTGATSLTVISGQMANLIEKPLVSLLALAAILVGLGFKMGLVPFHVWVSDTFSGAPTPVSAYLSVAPKMAAVVFAVRFLGEISDVEALKVMPLIAVISALTMTVANLLGLQQRNVLRLLGYSSVAHMGYLLMGVVTRSSSGDAAIAFYGWTYLFMTVGAFAVVGAIMNQTQSTDLRSFAGLSRRSPVLAAALTFFVLGLAGLPPTAGFFAKFYLFSIALEGGWIGLTLVGAVNIVVAIAYYFGLLRTMYFDEPLDGSERIRVSGPSTVAWVFSAVATLFLGLAPQPFLGFNRDKVRVSAKAIIAAHAAGTPSHLMNDDKKAAEQPAAPELHDVTLEGLPQ